MRRMRALSYMSSRHFNLPVVVASIWAATRKSEVQPECKSRISHELGLDPRAAFDFWKNELILYKEAYAAFKKSFEPEEYILSKEFAKSYIIQRGVNISYVIDGLYGEDISRLPAFLVQRDVAFNCFPLVLSILEKGFATYPSCLDEQNRSLLTSSACAIIINGGPHIAYLFKRSDSEINSIIFGGCYGMILATCTIKSSRAKIRWFGSETDGPRSLQAQIDSVEKLARQILAQQSSIAREISRHKPSRLPPLCLVGHFNSLGHYIWNELPLLSIVDKLPKPLHVAVGDYDFANFLHSHNSAAKFSLGCTDISDIAHSLVDEQVHLSLRPLVILKDIFSIGKQETKAVIHQHLDRLADGTGAAKSAINHLTIAIGLRITGARRFLSTVDLIRLIDSIFDDKNLQPSYYLDGYTMMPARPGFNSSASALEASAVEALIGGIPAPISDRIIPYRIPTMADKRIILESCLCGFFPIGSSAILQGWLTSIPAFYFDDGRYYKEFVQQDYVCNHLKDSCYFIEPRLFCSDPAKDGYGISDSLALRDYLKLKIGILLDEHFAQ